MLDSNIPQHYSIIWIRTDQVSAACDVHQVTWIRQGSSCEPGFGRDEARKWKPGHKITNLGGVLLNMKLTSFLACLSVFLADNLAYLLSASVQCPLRFCRVPSPAVEIVCGVRAGGTTPPNWNFTSYRLLSTSINIFSLHFQIQPLLGANYK